jgi:hypothetical protein
MEVINYDEKQTLCGLRYHNSLRISIADASPY